MSTFFIGGTATDRDILNQDAPAPPGFLFFNFVFVSYNVPRQDPTFVIETSSPATKGLQPVAFTPADQRVEKLPQGAPQVGIWLTRVQVPPGVRIQVTTTVPGEPLFPRQDVFAFDPPANTTGPVPLFAHTENPPRLVVALNSTFVSDPRNTPRFQEFTQKKGSALDFTNPGSIEVRYLINRIYDRLKDDFIVPWLGPDGGPLSSVPDTKSLPKDEQWARLMAEMFTATPYTTPSTAYQDPAGLQFTDEHLLAKLQDDADPAYPIVGECQHHVTAAALGRGFSFPMISKPGSDGVTRAQLQTMFTAGPSKGAVDLLAPAGEATWVDAAAGTTDLSKLGSDFQAGSAFSFNNNPPSQDPGNHPHIAYVIRVSRNAANAVDKIQFFDVFGMNVPEPKHPAIPSKDPDTDSSGSKLGTATYEYPFSRTGKEGALGAYAGTSALSAKPATLDKGVARLSHARPIGLARLVIGLRTNTRTHKPVDLTADAIDDWLLWASPLVRMYETDPALNYSIARYLWSLREMPGAANLMAIWQVSVPRGELCDAMVFGLGKTARRPAGRGTKIAEMVGDVAARHPGTKINTDGSQSLALQKFSLGIIDVANDTDGSVVILDICKSDFKTSNFLFLERDKGNHKHVGAFALGDLPWGRPTTRSSAIDLATFSDIPDYFLDKT